MNRRFLNIILNLLFVLGSKQGETLYNVFILKCISLTNLSITWMVLLDNNKE